MKIARNRFSHIARTMIGATVVAVAIAAITSTAHAQTGPITAAQAKAERAKTVPAAACVLACKKRGNVAAADCGPKWCVPGVCYRSTKESYCVK